MLVRSVVIIYLVFSYSSIFFLTNIIKWNYLAKIMIFREFGKKNKKNCTKLCKSLCNNDKIANFAECFCDKKGVVIYPSSLHFWASRKAETIVDDNKLKYESKDTDYAGRYSGSPVR